jgi:VanZ family protein
MFRNNRAWFLPIIWAILLFISSSIPNFTTESFSIKLSDKIWHFIAYMPLGFLMHYAMEQKPGPFVSAPASWSALFGILYGIFDEFHQYFVPGRFLDGFDLVANTLGVLFGIWLFLIFRKLNLGQKENIT